MTKRTKTSGRIAAKFLLATWLRERRTELGLTQRELADRSGVAAKYISQLEARTTAGNSYPHCLPGLSTLLMLTAVLGLVPLSTWDAMTYEVLGVDGDRELWTKGAGGARGRRRKGS